jgi:hypothetical protein
VSVADEQPGHLQKRGGSQAKGVIAWIPSRPQPGCRLGRQALQPALVCESDGIGVDLLHQARQTALATIVIFDGRRHAAHGFDDRAPARRRDHSRDAALRLPGRLRPALLIGPGTPGGGGAEHLVHAVDAGGLEASPHLPKAIGAVARHLAEATYWLLSKQEAYREPQASAVSSTGDKRDFAMSSRKLEF